jgi:hypothetical protein
MAWSQAPKKPLKNWLWLWHWPPHPHLRDEDEV